MQATALLLPQDTEMPQGMRAVAEPAGEGPSGTEPLAGALIAMAATAHELYLQAHICHFNIEGPDFFELHKFLRKQYERHLEQFDVLAEMVRSLDYFLPMCGCGLREAAGCFRHVQSLSTREMLLTYLGNLEAFGMAAKELEKLGQQACAPDVANYAAEIVGEAFKRSWQLKAFLRG